MDKVMDRVVETQFKIYNAICYRVWKLCFLGNRQPSLQVSIRVSVFCPICVCWPIRVSDVPYAYGT